MKMVPNSGVTAFAAALLLAAASSCAESKSDFVDDEASDTTPGQDAATDGPTTPAASDEDSQGVSSTPMHDAALPNQGGDHDAGTPVTEPVNPDGDATAHADAAVGSTLDGSVDDPTIDVRDASAPSVDAAIATDAALTLIDPVDLGLAGNFVILAKSGISSVPTSAVVGDVGISPAAATFITGFSLVEDASAAFALAPQVTGMIFAADYADDTPTMLTTAVADMELAYTDAAGRAADFTEVGTGDIGGLRLHPGVYKWGTGVLIPSDVTLEGSASDIWIFQIAQDLNLSSAVSVVLSGGALPEHVFWQVAGSVELGTTAHAEGIVLAMTSVALQTGASINGRLLAQTAVTLDSSSVVQPAD